MKNYHTHTKRCRHAQDEDREYVESAIKAGYSEIGFSDHAPILFSTSYYSNFRMFPNQIEDYVKSITELKEEYKDEISIKLGYELEYYPNLFYNTLDLLCSYPIDYLILGQHFICNEEDKNAFYSGSPTHKEDILKTYVLQCIEGLETKKFTYLAHPDLINYKGKSKIYLQYMTELCKGVKELGIPIEMNFLGFQQNRNYPNHSFWQIASDVGCDVVIGLDAHSSSSYNDKESLDKMKKYINSLNLNLVEDIHLIDPKK